MITNTNHVGSTPTHALDPRRERASSSSVAAHREDSLSTTHATDLKAALSRTETLRPEVVERASQLALEPSYPSADIIVKVADLLASSQDLSEEQD